MDWLRREQTRRDRDGDHKPQLSVARVAAALGSLLLGTVVLIGGRAAAAPQATIVRCDPATVAGPLGTELDVDIYVQDVVDLWAADVRIAFDETALQVVDAEPDPDLQPGEVDPIQIQPLDTFLKPDFVLYKGVEELDGQPVIWYVATQMGNVVGREPVSGSGPLAKITFRALRAGQFTLPIIYQKIVLRTGAQIPSTAQGCSVTFFEIDAGGVTFVPFTSAN